MAKKTTEKAQKKAVVGIIMGSDSDLPVMQAAAAQLTAFDIPFELTVVSAHRTPLRMVDYATTARERGIKVIIAGAGGAAHLPGYGCFTYHPAGNWRSGKIIQFTRWLGFHFIHTSNAQWYSRGNRSPKCI